MTKQMILLLQMKMMTPEYDGLDLILNFKLNWINFLCQELTADVEKQFFKTLACLKKGDPRLYDEKIKFFEKKDSTDAASSKAKSSKEKPMFLRDYERKLLLEKGGQVSSDEEGIFVKRTFRMGISDHCLQ